MDYRTLLVVGESPSVDPLLNLLHLLVRQRLIEPIVVAIPGRERFVSTLFDPRRDEASTVDRTTFIGGEVRSFTVCHLILADHVEASQSTALAYDMEKALFDAVSLVGQDARQRVDLVNLLAPAPVEQSMPLRLGLEGERGEWVNVILMPEVQERSDLAASPVRMNAEYVGHVATGLASLLSLWVGRGDQNDERIAKRLGSVGDREHWHLFRSRSRTLSAPELPHMVLNDLTRTILVDARRGDVNLEMIAEGDADRTIKKIRGVYAGQHSLNAIEPPPAGSGDQRVVSIREFLRLVWKFFASIPRRVLEELASWILMLKALLLRQLDEIVKTDQLDFRFSTHRRKRDDGAAGGETDPLDDDRGLRSGAADTKPAMWSELRSLAFGLLDGGNLPDPYRHVVDHGTTRFILPDPRYVVAPPTGAVSADDVTQLDVFLPDPSLWDEEPRGLVDGIVHLMFKQHLKALGIESDLKRRAEELLRKHEEIAERHRKGGWIRRLFRGLWRIIRLLVIIGAFVAAVLLAGIDLPLVGSLPAVAVVIMQVMLIGAALAWIRRLLVKWFRSDHLAPSELPEVVDLRRRAVEAQRQGERLHHQGEVAREWMAIIQSVIYNPYGPPEVTTNNRIRRVDLHLPIAHKVEDAVVSEMRLEGIVSAARQAVFSVGWLQRAYTESVGHARREHDIRAPGAQFEPDSDPSLPGQRQQAARATVRMALQSGRAMRAARHELSRRVHQMLSTGSELPVDGGPLENWLFTRTVEDVEPAKFLDETLWGDQSAWNRSFLRLVTGGDNPALKVERVDPVERANYSIPASLKPEEIDDGLQLDFSPLQFRSSVIEMSRDVPEEGLVFFSGTPTPVSVDLVGVDELWQIPPDIDYGEVVELPDEERDRWGIVGTDLPEREEVIGPRGPVGRVGGQGQFAFVHEVGGRPVALADRRVRYRVRTEAAPPNATEIIRWVLQTTADVTGVEFVYDGTRSDLPGRHEMFDYVFLAWAFKGEYERYEVLNGFKAGSSIGLGGSHPGYDPSGMVVLQGGSAVLNAEMALPHATSSGPNHATVLLHELGHVLNLAHVPSTSEIMHPILADDGPETWGPGDRRGLSLIAQPAMRSRRSAA